MKKVFKYVVLLSTGGGLYMLIEMLFRGYSHWTMFIVGGICFVLCGLVNEILPWEMPVWLQMTLCMVIITSVELVAGMIINIGLGLAVWDYSNLPFNFLGQICLYFSAAWWPLSGLAIILDDYLRYWWFKEERPKYFITKS